MLIQKFIKRWYNIFRMRSPKIAIVIHAYHLNVLQEILDCVQNVPGDFDLFLNFSYIPHSQKKMIDNLKKNLKKAVPGTCYFTTSNNRGQDLGGFFASTEVARRNKLSYDFICKLHTKSDSKQLTPFKKSGYTFTDDVYTIGAKPNAHNNYNKTEWRQSLLSTLLGTKDRVHKILKLFHLYPSVGMVCVKDFYGPHDFNMNDNVENYQFFKNKMKLSDEVCWPNNKNFAAGTMFWLRGDVWDFLMKQKITIKDFELGASHDGLRSHAFERIFDPVVKHLGYSPWMIEGK